MNLEDFDFVTLEEELQVDRHCQGVLQVFYQWLQQEGLGEEQASRLAYSADYYVRDYLIDFLRANLLRPEAGIVRYFAGNWYITRTMEPDMVVLSRHLDGISWLYRYLSGRLQLSPGLLQQLEQEAADTDFYRGRIESFNALSGDGFTEWDSGCRLKEGGRSGEQI